MSNRPPVLGLTGSIGSGKTFVTRCFEELGAIAIRADDLAREVTVPGTEAHGEIVRLFGANVVRADGTLDRAEIARRVFSNREELRRLEGIIHPRVRAREVELIARHRNAPLIVLEIPLLFETGAQDLCDKVLVVTVSEAERHRRLRSDRNMTGTEIEARLAAQMPEAEKVRRADYVIDNTGSVMETRAAVESLYRTMTASA